MRKRGGEGELGRLSPRFNGICEPLSMLPEDNSPLVIGLISRPSGLCSVTCITSRSPSCTCVSLVGLPFSSQQEHLFSKTKTE